MSNFTGDLVYAFRQFRRSPLFTLTAVLTLGVGIGGTTAMFSLMHAHPRESWRRDLGEIDLGTWVNVLLYVAD